MTELLRRRIKEFNDKKLEEKRLQKYEKKKAAWIGFGIGATVGMAKEIYDMRCGHSDMKDLHADLLGAAIGAVTIRIRF